MHSEQMLAASIAALAVGPLAAWALRDRAKPAAFLDGLVLASLVGVLTLQVLPSAVATGGFWALGLAIVGMFLPRILDKSFGHAKSHRLALLAAVVGLGLHAISDGLAVGGAHAHGHAHGSHGLEWAVIIHRLSVGLAVWVLMRRSEGGVGLATAALAVIGACTVAGYTASEKLLVWLPENVIGLFEGFMAGLLLHVVMHGRSDQDKTSSALGSTVGLVVVVGLAWDAVASDPDGVTAKMIGGFWSLLVESAPALLLAYALAGLIGVFLRAAPARWLSKGGAHARALRGVVFGLPLPLCSCGVVPVYRSLVKKGAPAAGALAFLVATPELGLDAVLISFPLLGPKLAVARVIAAFIVALVVGVLVGGWADRKGLLPKPSKAGVADGKDDRSLLEKVRAGLDRGYGEVLDSTGPWIFLGLVIAAAVTPWFEGAGLTSVPHAAQIALFAVIGMPIYVCATGATPMVAAFLAVGLSPGAAVAFLLTGPATNATTYGVLRQLHGRSVAVAFGLGVMAAAIGAGYAVDAFIAAPAEEMVGHAHEHGTNWLGVSSAVVLGGLFVRSLFRQGPRGFLARLWDDHEHDHDHDHDHGAKSCCGHDHDDEGGHGHDHGHDHDHGDDHRTHGEHEHDHDGHGHAHEHESKGSSCCSTEIV